MQVQLLLADQGHHRAPSIPGATVLHVEKDFELIAGSTGKQIERLTT